MNIRGHLGSDLIGKRHVADAMGTFQVTHSRILARANHSDHGLIVVVEDEVGVSTPQLLPKGDGRQPQTSHSKVGRYNLGLRCGVA